jgi:hypothetical protein
MAERKNKYVKEITIGVLSSTIFLIFIQPILNLIWNFLKTSTFSLYQSMSSKIIRQAALGEVNFSDSLIMLGLLSIFLIVFIEMFSKINALTKKYKNLGQEDEHTENDPNTSKPKLSLEELKVSQLKKLKILKYFLIIHFTLAFIWGAYQSSRIMISKGLIAEFNQKTNILSPYITDQKLKELKSEWALMKTIEDFNRISSEIKILASSLKIELPKSVYF